MAEINLLKQNAGGLSIGKNIPKFLLWVFLAVLAALVAYYVWLYFDSKSIDVKMTAALNKISSDNQTAANMKGGDQLFTTQQQIQSLSGLISSHIYWSQLFQPLAEATLKNATYSSLTADLNNGLTLDVTVPSLEDLDKYMQIFNLTQFNQNFSNVRIGGYSKIQNGNSTGIKFQVQMQYNPKIIQYQAPTNNAG